MSLSSWIGTISRLVLEKHFKICVIAEGKQGCIFVANIKEAKNATYGLRDDNTGCIITLTLTLCWNLQSKLILWCANYSQSMWCDCLKASALFFLFSLNMTLGFLTSLHVQKVSLKLSNPSLLLNGTDSWEGLLDFYRNHSSLLTLSFFFVFAAPLRFFLSIFLLTRSLPVIQFSCSWIFLNFPECLLSFTFLLSLIR